MTIKDQPTVVEGQLSAKGLTVGIIVARFNSAITDRLLDGALQLIARHGGSLDKVTVLHVPGAFELPGAAKKAASTGKFDALVCLGAVIRGATPHFDYVCSVAASGISQVALESGLPVSFGVLTTDSSDQALERAGIKGGNKGAEAAASAIEMANLYRRIEGSSK